MLFAQSLPQIDVTCRVTLRYEVSHTSAALRPQNITENPDMNQSGG